MLREFKQWLYPLAIAAILLVFWFSVNWKDAFGALAGFRDYDDR
jgi:hypothetical protein